MYAYILRRLALAVPTVILVTLGVFLLVRVIPGDIAVLKLGAQATEEQLDQFRAEIGLDEPIPVQYVKWLGGIFTGDLGESLWEGRPVTTVIIEKYPVTLELAVLAILMSMAVGIPLGVVSAVRQDSAADHGLRFSAILFLAIPSFWMGILLITLPSIWWGWKPPTSGFQYIWEAPLENLWRMFWPALITSAATLGLVMRLTRSSVLEVLREDYVRTARAKGLGGRTVIWRHVLRNALIPVITVLGLSLSVLLGGSVVAETVFAVPGMGRSMLQAVSRRDYPLLQGYVLVFATTYVLMNLIVDIMYSSLDPRIRYR